MEAVEPIFHIHRHSLWSSILHRMGDKIKLMLISWCAMHQPIMLAGN